jgi:hypothetical protein
MRTLIRWAARLYPEAWRDRYAAEFDALLDDIFPSLSDLCDVLGDVLRVRVTAPVHPWLASVAGSPMTLRTPVFFSLTAHAVMIVLLLVAAAGYVSPMPSHLVIAPLPPAVPEAPPEVTDARVFPNASTLYSSLPIAPAKGNVIPMYVADGVGINFLSLPEIGAVYRQGNVERRVWPGPALESFIVRRVLPEYPRDTSVRSAVSVFVEYVIRRDGSVKVLRTAGPTAFTRAAQSAIEQWVYRPLGFEDRRCEVISRVEVRFDGAFVEDETR